MKRRSEIEEKFKWDLTGYFKDDDAFYREYEDLKTHVNDFEKYKGKLSDEKTMLECLKLEENISLRLEILYVYASLKTREDATNSFYRERLTLVDTLASKFSVETTFIDIEIKKYKTSDLKRLAETTPYKNYFKGMIKDRKLILSEKEEKIISMSGEMAGGFSENFDVFDDGDLKFNSPKDNQGKKHTLTHSNYVELMQSDDRTLRKNTIKALNGAYGKFNNFLSSNYIHNVKKNVFYTRLRKFKSTLDLSIYAEEASRKVYGTLISSMHDNLFVFHKYFDVKRRSLGLNKFAIYDQFAKEKGVKKTYTFEEAIDLIKKATLPLGKEYQMLINRAVNERWIDIYPNENKDSGAFSWGAYSKNPVVLTNFIGDTNSIFTLAHELGHAMHTYYSNSTQNFDQAGYTIFVAEVASNVNEMLLLKYLSENSDNKSDIIYYYDHFLSEFKGSAFRQLMFSEFEQFAHEQYENDKPISAKILNDFYYQLNKTYFGKDVELVPEIQYEWSRIPHFYNAFYVYKYAIGIISALYIVYKVLPTDPERYLNFLKAGSTKDPISLLKDAGVNLKDKKVIDNAFEYALKIIGNWEKLL